MLSGKRWFLATQAAVYNVFNLESHLIRHYAEVRYDASCYESAR